MAPTAAKRGPPQPGTVGSPKGGAVSVVILAGGMSVRMGRDKAFLRLGKGRFISIIAATALKVSDDVIVAVGRKPPAPFKKILPPDVTVVNDVYNVANPVGGILSGFERCRNTYAAVLACDLPLVDERVITLLYRRAKGHSAAVPIWENGDIEPLCAVYHVEAAEEAGRRAIESGKIAPREMIHLLEDAVFVEVGDLRAVDPRLGSLMNVNLEQDYARLRGRSSAAGKR